MEEPGGLYSSWDHEESDTMEQLTLALPPPRYLCVDASENGECEVQAITSTLVSRATQCAHRQFYLSFFDLVWASSLAYIQKRLKN